MTQVLPLSENETLDNMRRVLRDQNSKPVDQLKAIAQVLGYKPTWTVKDLACEVLGVTEGYILDLAASKARASTKIRSEAIQGKITFAAYWIIAKLPLEEQEDWLEKAKILEIDDFEKQVVGRIMVIRERRRQHAKENPPQEMPQPVPFIRVEHDEDQYYLMFGNMQLDGAIPREHQELIDTAARMRGEWDAYGVPRTKCLPPIQRKVVWP